MKRKSLIFITIAILLIVSVNLFACTNVGGWNMLGENKVAVVSLNGPVQAQASSGLFLGGSAITPQLVRSQLDKARNDYAVKAVVLQIESPGGSIAACQDIVNEIDRLGKPVVVSLGTLAASGGYYIAAKADKIVALPGTLTGSIGVISEVPNLKGLYDKLGIKMDVFTSGRYKDMYAGVRELSPEERALVQDMNDQLYEQFVKAVAECRGLNEAKVRELATGQLYTGEQAKELGLVDKLGGLSTAINLAADLASVENPKVEYYSPEVPSLLRSLFNMSVQRLQSIVQLQSLGAEGIILLQILSNPYPQPEYR